MHNVASLLHLHQFIANAMKVKEQTTATLFILHILHLLVNGLSVSDRTSAVASFKVMDVLRRANELEKEGTISASNSVVEGANNGSNKKNMKAGVAHCEIGQPQTGAPAPVARAAVDALTQGSTMGYTDAFGLLALREKISKHYAEKYDKLQSPPSTDRIVVTTGSSGAFLLAFTACFDVGDVVAIATSGYPCYRNILTALGVQQANIGINAEFKITAHELSEEITRRQKANEDPIKGIILSSPSNPTGAMLSPDELQELCELCDEHNIQFLSDEIYHGISYGKEEATALQYSEKVIVINSFSKYYSMSGWRLGWMVVPEHLTEAINRLQQNMSICAPTISQTAALQCWSKETIEILEGHVKMYAKSRELILKELATIEEIDPTNIAPADGGFYVYIDLGDENVAPGFGSVKMCETFLEEELVALTPGNDFEDPSTHLGDRRFRISYAGGIDVAQSAMERFHRFWPTWVKRVREGRSKR